MNYGLIGSVGRPYHDPSVKRDDDDEGNMKLAKRMLSENRRSGLAKRIIQQQEYMDKMKQNLNECTAKHITPYWRNHPSMKGKSIAFVF